MLAASAPACAWPCYLAGKVRRGTGDLTRLILGTYQPKEIISMDPSSDFISHAQRVTTAPTVHFRVGLAESLDSDSNSIDIWMIVQGLKVVAERKTGHIDHTARNDKSIFRLGMDWLRYCLKRGFDFEPVFLIHSENEHVNVR